MYSIARFSALQRAENSSIVPLLFSSSQHAPVSVLFSEPKIPQCQRPTAGTHCKTVSVLFSEPKIPQLRRTLRAPVAEEYSFSALQRAENSSISQLSKSPARNLGFQCSSASRKFLNAAFSRSSYQNNDAVSVLFSEPKIPQFTDRQSHPAPLCGFSALQRAENSSI